MAVSRWPKYWSFCFQPFVIRRRGQVARQGSAKPSSWVQIPSSPLFLTHPPGHPTAKKAWLDYTESSQAFCFLPKRERRRVIRGRMKANWRNSILLLAYHNPSGLVSSCVMGNGKWWLHLNGSGRPGRRSVPPGSRGKVQPELNRTRPGKPHFYAYQPSFQLTQQSREWNKYHARSRSKSRRMHCCRLGYQAFFLSKRRSPKWHRAHWHILSRPCGSCARYPPNGSGSPRISPG